MTSIAVHSYPASFVSIQLCTAFTASGRPIHGAGAVEAQQALSVAKRADQAPNIMEDMTYKLGSGTTSEYGRSVGDSSPLPGSTSDNSIYVKYGPEELSPPRRALDQVEGVRISRCVSGYPPR